MKRTLIAGAVVSMFFLSAAAVKAEEVKVSTYYPSPYGVYKNLDTTQDAHLATTSGSVGVGTMVPSAPFTVEKSAYTSGLVVLNNGTTGAPNVYPNGYTPTLVVNSAEAVGSRPLFFGYKNGGAWDATLNAGACGAFTQMCLDMGSGATVYTALENVGTTLNVGGGDDGNFTNVAFRNSGNVGIGSANPQNTLDVNGGIRMKDTSSNVGDLQVSCSAGKCYATYA